MFARDCGLKWTETLALLHHFSPMQMQCSSPFFHVPYNAVFFISMHYFWTRTSKLGFKKMLCTARTQSPPPPNTHTHKQPHPSNHTQATTHTHSATGHAHHSVSLPPPPPPPGRYKRFKADFELRQYWDIFESGWQWVPNRWRHETEVPRIILGFSFFQFWVAFCLKTGETETVRKSRDMKKDTRSKGR